MRSVVECCGFSLAKDEPGRQNQDYFDCQPRAGAGLLPWADFVAVVADGVGSTAGPKDAAATAAQTWELYARAKFVENAAECADFDDLHFDEITAHAFVQAHEAVQRDTSGGACAAAVCMQGNRLILGNVGDCRIYRINRSGVEQLSEDQVDQDGDPTEVIGGKRVPEPHTSAGARVRPGDVIVVCTDGAWKLVEPTEMQQAASGRSARDIADRLERLLVARRKPDSDDATAVVALVRYVGKPFWGTGSASGGDQLEDDWMETKLNEVLAELLNRLRAPLEKQNARAEQSLTQLTTAVDELRSEIDALRSEAGRTRRGRKAQGTEWQGIFWSVALSLLILVGGVFLGWAARGWNPASATRFVKPQLPANSRVISQGYSNDRLLIRFLGQDGKARLAIFRLEDGGRPFAVIEMPSEPRANVPVH